MNLCLYVCVPHQRALHDAFEVDEVQVVGRGGAGGAVAHRVQHLGHYNTYTHTEKSDRGTIREGNKENETELLRLYHCFK